MSNGAPNGPDAADSETDGSNANRGNFNTRDLQSSNQRTRGHAQALILDQFESPNRRQNMPLLGNGIIRDPETILDRSERTDIVTQDFGVLRARDITREIRASDGREVDGSYPPDPGTGELPDGTSKQLRIPLAQLANLELHRRTNRDAEGEVTDVIDGNRNEYEDHISRLHTLLTGMLDTEWNNIPDIEDEDASTEETRVTQINNALAYLTEGNENYLLELPSRRGRTPNPCRVRTRQVNEFFACMRGIGINTDAIQTPEQPVQQDIETNIDYNNTRVVFTSTTPGVTEVNVEVTQYASDNSTQSEADYTFSTDNNVDFSSAAGAHEIGIRTYAEDSEGRRVYNNDQPIRFSFLQPQKIDGTTVPLTITRPAPTNVLTPTDTTVNVAGSIDCSYVTRTNGTRAVRVSGVPDDTQTLVQFAYDNGSTRELTRAIAVTEDGEVDIPNSIPQDADVYMAIGLPENGESDFADDQFSGSSLPFESTPERQYTGTEVNLINGIRANITSLGQLSIDNVSVGENERFDLAFSGNSSEDTSGELGELQGVTTFASMPLTEDAKRRVASGQPLYVKAFITDTSDSGTNWKSVSSWIQLPYTVQEAEDAETNSEQVELAGNVVITAHEYNNTNGILVKGLGSNSTYSYQITPSSQDPQPIPSANSTTLTDGFFVPLPDDCTDRTEVGVAVGMLSNGANTFNNFQTITGFPGSNAAPDPIEISATPIRRTNTAQLSIEETSNTGEELTAQVIDEHDRVIGGNIGPFRANATFRLPPGAPTDNLRLRILGPDGSNTVQPISFDDVLPEAKRSNFNLNIDGAFQLGQTGFEDETGNTIHHAGDSLLQRMDTAAADGIPQPVRGSGVHEYLSTTETARDFRSYSARLTEFLEQNVIEFWQDQPNNNDIINTSEEIRRLLNGFVRTRESEHRGRPVTIVLVDHDRIASIRENLRNLQTQLHERVDIMRDSIPTLRRVGQAMFDNKLKTAAAIFGVPLLVVAGWWGYAAYSGSGESAKPREGSDPPAAGAKDHKEYDANTVNPADLFGPTHEEPTSENSDHQDHDANTVNPADLFND